MHENTFEQAYVGLQKADKLYLCFQFMKSLLKFQIHQGNIVLYCTYTSETHTITLHLIVSC